MATPLTTGLRWARVAVWAAALTLSAAELKRACHSAADASLRASFWERAAARLQQRFGRGLGGALPGWRALPGRAAAADAPPKATPVDSDAGVEQGGFSEAWE
jgi:hypothetical protein